MMIVKKDSPLLSLHCYTVPDHDNYHEDDDHDDGNDDGQALTKCRSPYRTGPPFHYNDDDDEDDEEEHYHHQYSNHNFD